MRAMRKQDFERLLDERQAVLPGLEDPSEGWNTRDRSRCAERLEHWGDPWDVVREEVGEELGRCDGCDDRLWRIDLWFTPDHDADDPREGTDCHRCGNWECVVGKGGGHRGVYPLDDDRLFDVDLDEDASGLYCGWCEESISQHNSPIELPGVASSMVWTDGTVVYDPHGQLEGPLRAYVEATVTGDWDEVEELRTARAVIQ